MRKHLYLDLEGTLIEPCPQGLANAIGLNCSGIAQFIRRYEPDEVNIFSFALHTRFDASSFELFLRERLEARLGVVFKDVLTVDHDIRPACARVLGVPASELDFRTLSVDVGKQQAFRLYVRDRFSASSCDAPHVALIDDDVVDELFQVPEICLRGQVIQVAGLQG